MVRRKFSGKDIAIGISAVVVVVLILMFYIWHQAESVRLGYRTQELERELQGIREEIAALEAEKTRQLSPERVEKIAREKLGFTEVRDDQIVPSSKKSTGNEGP
jgi:cell division protein FtsL